MTGSAPDTVEPAEPRGRHRAPIRRRVAMLPAFVLLLCAVNTGGATLAAAEVAGPGPMVAAAAGSPYETSVDALPDAATAVVAGAPAGDAVPLPSDLVSVVITGPAGTQDDAPATPVAPFPGRSTRLDPARVDPPVVAHLVFRVSTNRRLIALTFDDGYNPPALRQIVGILEQEQVTATFFVNGMYLSWAPEVWQRIAADGFAVGNHTYRHTDVRTLTTDQIVADLTRTALAWRTLTGTAMAPIFRPPYGAHTPATDLAAARAGFPTVVLWDTNSGDAISGTGLSQVIGNAIKGGSGSIVLMHAGPSVTPLALPDIIDWYRARGFTFVTVPALLGLTG
jgi:peptidoglycan/xylan/chitin deacetylase (PgdA/CDA1 family)